MYVLITPNYYAGTLGVPETHYATNAEVAGDNHVDYECEIHNFETSEAAQAWIDEKEEGTYYLAHGEAGRPSYEIVDDFPESECESGEGEDFPDYEEVDIDVIPADIKAGLDNLNVRDDDHGRWIADYMGYRVCYYPRPEALQLHADDLGGLNWDNAGYYIQIIDDTVGYIRPDDVPRRIGKQLQCEIYETSNDIIDGTRDYIVRKDDGKYYFALESTYESDWGGPYDDVYAALAAYEKIHGKPCELSVDGWFNVG